MQTISLELQNDTAIKFNTYIQLFGNKELMFENFISYHISRLKREIAEMQKDLKDFEKKYDMTSADFFEKFENGQLSDNKNFILWSGIYEMQTDCKQKLSKIQ